MKSVHRLLSLVVAILLFASVAVIMPACNTVKGLGEDITAVGEGGEDLIDGDDEGEHDEDDD